MLNDIRQRIEASIVVKQALLADAKLLTQLADLSTTCLEALASGGKIIFAGNGGSFADAQHLSAEFVSRFLVDRAPLPSVALGTNSSSMSAIGNDYGYDRVFARELDALGHKPDVFIPISTSGNSPNVLAAVDIAIKRGITTVAWTGATGGLLKARCPCICVPSNETPHIQECHILMGHIMCALVERDLLKEQDPACRTSSL